MGFLDFCSCRFQGIGVEGSLSWNHISKNRRGEDQDVRTTYCRLNNFPIVWRVCWVLTHLYLFWYMPLADFQDAWAEGWQEDGPRGPLWWWVLYQEGGLAGSSGGEGCWEAAATAVRIALEQQGERATGLGCEGYAAKQEEPTSWLVSKDAAPWHHGNCKGEGELATCEWEFNIYDVSNLTVWGYGWLVGSLAKLFRIWTVLFKTKIRYSVYFLHQRWSWSCWLVIGVQCYQSGLVEFHDKSLSRIQLYDFVRY